MNEIIELMTIVSRDVQLIKAWIENLQSERAALKDTWLDGQDVMQTLHISKRTLQTLRDTGLLPYSRINGKFYYKAADIEILLNENYSGELLKGKTNGIY